MTGAMNTNTAIIQTSLPTEEERRLAELIKAEASMVAPGGWLKFESGWLSNEQVERNLELSVSLLQTFSARLDDLDKILTESISFISSWWANGNKNQAPPREIEQMLVRRLSQIDELVRNSRFHGRGLMDGQSGAVGQGVGVEFVRGGPATTHSGKDGFEVLISSLPTRPAMVGGVPLHEAWLKAEEEIFLAEGDRFIRYTPGPKETVEEFIPRLQKTIRLAGLDLDVGLTAQQRLMIRHGQYGSQAKFKGSSRKTPILSKKPGKLEWSRKGKDVQGTMQGEPAFGIGRMLVGYLDNRLTSELAVVWNGDLNGEDLTARSYVKQNAITFQEKQGRDQNLAVICLPSFHTDSLGKWVETRSRFKSLSDIQCNSWPEVNDALHMFFAVSCEIDEWQERVKGWISRYQGQALELLKECETLVAPQTGEPKNRKEAEEMASTLRRMIRASTARI